MQLTSIRVVSTWARMICWGWSSVSCKVIIVCVVLCEIAEGVTVLVEVT